MRVIAGRLRGRKLASFEAAHIRPTTDRVKQSIFNKLQADVPGAKVLDLFSGTGNLAIESISREAESVTAVESHRQSLHIIESNLKALDIEDEVLVVDCDVFEFLKAYQGPSFDLIFADPPFTEKLGDQLLRTIVDSKVLGESSILVLELSSREKMELAYQGRESQIECFDDRDYGDKRVTYWRLGATE